MPFKEVHNYKKRHQSLLEVLIAFALIALCVLPLIYPHVAIYRDQSKFAHKLELDHAVNLLYGKVLEKLYMNTIPWNELAQTAFPVDDALLHEIGYDKRLFYQGSYNFFDEPPKFKPKDPASPYSLYLYKLTFTFIPIELAKTPEKVKDTDKIKYRYDVFVVRDLRGKP